MRALSIAPPPAPSLWRRAVALAARTTGVVRRIVGVPDYDAYVSHLRKHHAGDEPMARDVFIQKCWEDKYSRPGHRCC